MENQIQKLLRNFSIEFSYNGDLGKLQHQTKANILFVNQLAEAEIITEEQENELFNRIHVYYWNELRREIDKGYLS